MKTEQGTSVVIEAPDRAELAREHTGLVERAKAFPVTNKTDHEDALVIARELKAAQKRVEDRLTPIIEAAHKAHKGLTTLRADAIAPIKEALEVIARKCLDFEAKERAKAEAEQRRLQEEARRAEEDRQLADAIAANESGDVAGADQILEAETTAPIVKVEPNVAKVNGVGSRSTWSAEVTDKAALVAYVAAHPEWLNLVEPNLTALNKLAQAQKDALKLPGVRPVEKKSLSIRTA